MDRLGKLGSDRTACGTRRPVSAARILPQPGRVLALAFSPDSSWLVSGCAPGESLNIWDVATARLKQKFKGPGQIALQAIAVSPDGTRIASGNADGSATVHGSRDRRGGHSFRMAAGGAKMSLAYSPDGQLLAGTGEESTHIDIWDAQTLRPDGPVDGSYGPCLLRRV